MKRVVISYDDDGDDTFTDEVVHTVWDALAEFGGISIEVEDDEEAAEFNQLMNDIEREEAGISWQSNP